MNKDEGLDVALPVLFVILLLTGIGVYHTLFGEEKPGPFPAHLEEKTTVVSIEPGR